MSDLYSCAALSKLPSSDLQMGRLLAWRLWLCVPPQREGVQWMGATHSRPLHAPDLIRSAPDKDKEPPRMTH